MTNPLETAARRALGDATFLDQLLLLLFGLKIAHVIVWSWWWILSPVGAMLVIGGTDYFVLRLFPSFSRKTGYPARRPHTGGPPADPYAGLADPTCQQPIEPVEIPEPNHPGTKTLQ